MSIVGQVEFFGKPFNLYFPIQNGDGDVLSLRQERRVRIIGGFNEETGKMVFYPIKEFALIAVALPRVPLALGDAIDRILQEIAFSTVKKEGASTAGVDVDEMVRERGGDPSYRLPKIDGFNLKSTAAEIAKERKKRIAKANEPIVFGEGP